MKTLLKISLCFVLCLFVATSVSATEPVEPVTETGGTITVTVVEFLGLEVATPNATFIYDEHGNTDDVSDKTSVVTVKASCDWNFTVKADNPTLSDGNHDPIALDVISYTIGTTTTPLDNVGVDFPGMTNDVFNVVWSADFTNLGNIYAGVYTVPVTYTVVKL